DANTADFLFYLTILPMFSPKYFKTAREVKDEKHRILPVVPWFRDGILLMGLILVFPIIYTVLYVVIQVAACDLAKRREGGVLDLLPPFDQTASTSSLARSVLLVAILWSSLKGGMIDNSRSFGFAFALIIFSEISLLITVSYSICAIVEPPTNQRCNTSATVSPSTTVSRSAVFLLVISCLEFVFNILLFRIIGRVHTRSLIKMMPYEEIQETSKSIVVECKNEHLKSSICVQSEEIVKERRNYVNRSIANLDKLIYSHYPTYHLYSLKEKPRGRKYRAKDEGNGCCVVHG
ncbi:hypothetical protein PMAYCL1PPCAC_02788, partial [Pristionchus mayeri]